MTTNVYSRIFNESNKHWMAHSESNKIFLKCQENWLNDRLNAIGHVFLNEVYDALGFSRTKSGAIVGWSKGGKSIDFNMEETEDGIFISFDVDGVIYDKLPDN